MKHKDPEVRLKMWGLTSLEERRKRGDMIQMYKIMHGLEDINWHFGLNGAPQTGTRGSEKMFTGWKGILSAVSRSGSTTSLTGLGSGTNSL